MCNIPTWALDHLNNQQLLTIIAECTTALRHLSTKGLPYRHTGAYLIQRTALKILEDRKVRV